MGNQADAEPNDAGKEVVTTTGAPPVGRRTQDEEDRERPGFYGGVYRGAFLVPTRVRSRSGWTETFTERGA